jgi:hypothetical protein
MTQPNTYDSDFQQSFSGADISVIIVLPRHFMIGAKGPMKVISAMQTLTISSTASVLPVRNVGRATPRSYLKGARTFAGTMIFTVLDKDPFQELFAIDTLQSPDISNGNWHIDQMPPFDIVITAANEFGTTAIQYIHEVTIMNHGVTYSVDDMYTESSYSYVAKYVSPFVKNPLTESFLNNLRKISQHNKTPDDITLEFLKKEKGPQPATTPGEDLSVDSILPNTFLQNVKPGFLWYMNGGTDPVISLIQRAYN